MNVLFAAALFGGSAAIACWIAARFPKIAPQSPVARGVGAFVTVQLAAMVPLATTSSTGLYCSVFLGLLPVLTAMWLCVVWLLQTARDALGAAR